MMVLIIYFLLFQSNIVDSEEAEYENNDHGEDEGEYDGEEAEGEEGEDEGEEEEDEEEPEEEEEPKLTHKHQHSRSSSPRIPRQPKSVTDSVSELLARDIKRERDEFYQDEDVDSPGINLCSKLGFNIDYCPGKDTLDEHVTTLNINDTPTDTPNHSHTPPPATPPLDSTLSPSTTLQEYCDVSLPTFEKTHLTQAGLSPSASAPPATRARSALYKRENSFSPISKKHVQIGGELNRSNSSLGIYTLSHPPALQERPASTSTNASTATFDTTAAFAGSDTTSERGRIR